MTADDLDGKVALVTGASSGIGRATARLLAAAGADVAVAARRRERLEAVADDVEAEGGDALVVPTDVTERGQVADLVAETVEAFGRLDVVVSNAGLARGGSVDDLAPEQFHAMMDVNCDGMFFLAQAALPHLREAAGNLILLGSMAGEYPRPANPVYAATKWWTRGFAHSLAASVGPDEVGVTVINPTEVRTEFGSEDGEASKSAYEAGEVSEPEDVAEAVLFAAEQEPPNVVHELDLYRRDKLSHF